MLSPFFNNDDLKPLSCLKVCQLLPFINTRFTKVLWPSILSVKGKSGLKLVGILIIPSFKFLLKQTNTILDELYQKEICIII